MLYTQTIFFESSQNSKLIDEYCLRNEGQFDINTGKKVAEY